MKHLPWDTEFFGVPIARADLREASFEATTSAARQVGVECLYLTVPADDHDRIADAIRRGARLVALREDFALELSGASTVTADTGVVVASAADRERVESLASRLAAFSRFNADPRFDDQRVAEMYRVWAGRCFEGGVVTLAPPERGFVGVTVDESCASVALVYVDPSASGRGLGQKLVSRAIATAATPRAVVATEAGNIAAARLYQSLGFRTTAVTAVLHAWLDEISSKEAR